MPQFTSVPACFIQHTKYLRASDALQLTEKNYIPSRDLYEHHAMAQRALETAEPSRQCRRRSGRLFQLRVLWWSEDLRRQSMRQDGIQKKERLISYKYLFNRVKVYGPDLKVLQNKALKINNAFADVPRFTGLTAVRELGQPRVLIDIDGEKIACHGINVSGLEAVIQAGVGGQAASRGWKALEFARPRAKLRQGACGRQLLPVIDEPSGMDLPDTHNSVFRKRREIEQQIFRLPPRPCQKQARTKRIAAVVQYDAIYETRSRHGPQLIAGATCWA